MFSLAFFKKKYKWTNESIFRADIHVFLLRTKRFYLHMSQTQIK